tara:strand:- start:1946 stop:3034 length:1089 start_codon:yes stop_codon:yes gene_type:complete
MKQHRKKLKKYIDVNVYDEAKNRIRHVINTFDTLVVMFSGGKDSLAVLHLLKEVYEEIGINVENKPINVVFRDEELIPETVIKFVDKYYKKSWVNMRYYAVPLYSQKYVLGETATYVQWDKNRDHIRKPPSYAIQLESNDNRIFAQDTMDSFVAKEYKGKIAFINGIRATESLVRYRSSVNKINENYINAPKGDKATEKNVRLVKPIYDWEENDVFKYFYEKNIEYCPVYDLQLWNGDQFRVATPIHQEAAKTFHRLKTLDPVLYSQVIEIFPDMLVQERYYKEFNKDSIKQKYAGSLQSILQYIKDTITDPKQKHEAYKNFQSCVKLHRYSPEAYPLKHIFNHFLGGGYKRVIMPMREEER